MSQAEILEVQSQLTAESLSTALDMLDLPPGTGFEWKSSELILQFRRQTDPENPTDSEDKPPCNDEELQSKIGEISTFAIIFGGVLGGAILFLKNTFSKAPAAKVAPAPQEHRIEEGHVSESVEGETARNVSESVEEETASIEADGESEVDKPISDQIFKECKEDSSKLRRWLPDMSSRPWHAATLLYEIGRRLVILASLEVFEGSQTRH